MSIQITLPNLGENVESGDVLSILVQEGDEVQAEAGLVELETDKATVEVPTPESGRVTKIHVAEGDTLEVGAVIATLEPSEAKPAKKKKAKKPPAPAAPPAASAAEIPPPAAAAPVEAPPAALPPAEPPAAAPAPATAAPSAPPAAHGGPAGDVDRPGDGRSGTAAGPAVRRLARELGVDLRQVRPSGEGGRITSDDVRAFVRTGNQQRSAQQSTGAAPPPGFPASDGEGGVRREKMSRMRKTIAKNMLQSYTTIPQLTNFDDADVTELNKIRKASRADYAQQGIKLTTLPFLIKAVASALKQHPVINASLDDEAGEIVYKEYVNIGIAVDTDRGLVVPVMRNVDQLRIPEIARQLSELADKVRDGSFTVDELRGGTFTISNLGAIGGTYSTPIINPPEVAILLVGRSRPLPVYVEEHLERRLMMPLSITYDHRVVDGAAAARFLNDVKDYLSAPGRLLLAP